MNINKYPSKIAAIMFHMKRFTSESQKTGEYGEKICQKVLIKSGFIIISRNYTKKVGEIDIIAKKGKNLHFIEVKSISCENTDFVSYETYNPAENMTKEKISKCWRTIGEYIKENSVSYETQLDLYMVYIDKRNIKHKVSKIENIF